MPPLCVYKGGWRSRLIVKIEALGADEAVGAFGESLSASTVATLSPGRQRRSLALSVKAMTVTANTTGTANAEG